MSHQQNNRETNDLWYAEELRIITQAFESTSLESRSTSSWSAVNGVQIDSRQVRAGDLFVPLGAPWAERDGHQFIDSAVERGASAYFCSDLIYDGDQAVVVSDTYEALQQLAALAVRRTPGAQRVALTGSSGKTTLRHWLGEMLASQCRYHASEGSFNNHLGVPLSLARMPRDTTVGVFEVGTNHVGEIAPLSKAIAPQLAIVLNILPVHIGHFPNFEALIDEKLSIANGVKNGVLLCPEAFKTRAETRPDLQILTFGTSQSADFEIEFDENGREVSVRDHRSSHEPPLLFSAPVTGRTYQETAAVALIVAKLLDQPLEPCRQALAQASMPPGRGKMVEISGITIIDDSYNANAFSMRAAIERLGATPAKRRIAVLGEMYELGVMSEQAHKDVSHFASQADEVWLVGSQFAAYGQGPKFRYVPTVDDLDVTDFAAALKAGDAILIKGSNGVFWKVGWVERLIKALESR